MKKTILFILFLSISLPMILLMTDVEIATFDMKFYEDKYKEHNIPEETGISMDNLMDVTSEMLDYLKGKRENLIIFTEVNGEREQVFEEREILHMVDVKELFNKGYIIRNTMMVIFIISIVGLIIFNRKAIGKALIITSIWPAVLMGILGLLMYIDFNKYFTHFHEIFFTNDLWLLDPKTDILIQMLPLDFFSSIAYRILLFFVVELALVLTIGIFLDRRNTIIKK
ncbi:integral membrane protein TIGR01906 [Proteiniborus ethanoligenes]|uniref:Integral membrane protein TIGR01906 n=1 Tax=Proteiniborus ethanoligenes TaxID=415015 RepID=A0A1H3PX49_9FIRM|nr:TIGR01906 family membrane protein [Proteiniborus ethanoligenes]TAH63957.1 MAG: TIGR01906 family membrane protein [Gottschalkiaceae bacterium]SDZ05882.1 integral membrane protein TIGR01906 [Proteiniborus ethanoligenes]